MVIFELNQNMKSQLCNITPSVQVRFKKLQTIWFGFILACQFKGSVYPASRNKLNSLTDLGDINYINYLYKLCNMDYKIL